MTASTKLTHSNPPYLLSSTDLSYVVVFLLVIAVGEEMTSHVQCTIHCDLPSRQNVPRLQNRFTGSLNEQISFDLLVFSSSSSK